MPSLYSRKASSVSRWLHWNSHAPAKFNLSRPVRGTHFWAVGRDTQLMQARANERAECDKSCQSDISNRNAHVCTCHAARTCNCPDGECADADRDDDYDSGDEASSNRSEGGSETGSEGRGEGGDEGRSQTNIISQHY